MVGYRENGTYMIDIDRNGLFSPARVECTMSAQRIETSIKNNLPLEYVSCKDKKLKLINHLKT